MALGATIYKANIQIADMDSQYYGTHALTLAQHPSETEERLMVRLLAFMLYASDSLAFGKGLSSEDEPALWQKDLRGDIELWIEVGQPDENDLRKASKRAEQVVCLAYGRTANVWWQQNRDKLQRLKNLSVIILPSSQTEALAKLATRTMQLQCNIQDGLVQILSGEDSVEIEPMTLMPID